MKGNRFFIIGIVALLVIVMLIEVKIPQRFSWNENFEHGNVQPFGCYVMDSVLSSSVTRGYSVTGNTLSQLLRDSTDASILYVSDVMELSSLEYQTIDRLLTRGNNVMIVAAYIDDDGISEADSALLVKRGIVWSQSGYFYYSSLESFLNKEDDECGILSWTGKMGGGEAQDYDSIAPQLVNGSLDMENFLNKEYICYTTDDESVALYENDDEEDKYVDEDVVNDKEEALPAAVPKAVNMTSSYDDLENTVLIEYEENYYGRDSNKVKSLKAVASKRASQRGTLFVVSMPLLFTNYSFLHNDTRVLAMRLLSLMGDKPIVRYDPSLGSGVGAEGSTSPLRYFLNNPSLRWATYLTVAALLLVMFFTARRRQRVIPVVKAPENRVLQFVEHMGLYYYSRHNNVDLVAKRYTLFAANLRRNVLLDITDSDREEIVAQLAHITGLEKKQLAADLNYLSDVADLDRDLDTVSDSVMRRCIDKMEEIEKAANKIN